MSKKVRKMFAIFLMLSAITLFFIPVSNSSFANKTKTEGSYNNSDLVVPNKDSIVKQGYPTNKNGQTYGPNMENLFLVEPDLMLVEGEGRVLGYIYQPDGISSPAELDEYNKSFKESTPVYLHDGVTIIGTFNFN